MSDSHFVSLIDGESKYMAAPTPEDVRKDTCEEVGKGVNVDNSDADGSRNGISSFFLLSGVA